MEQIDRIISPTEWMKSGSDSWYVIYPRCTITSQDSKFSFSKNYTTEFDLIRSSDWLICLKYYCNEAFTLISNLLKHQSKTTLMKNQSSSNSDANNNSGDNAGDNNNNNDINESMNTNDNPKNVNKTLPTELNLLQTSQDLYEKVFSRGGYGNIYIGCEDENSEEIRTFDHILKYVPITNDNNNNDSSNTEFVQQSQQQEQLQQSDENPSELKRGITFREYYLSKAQITESDVAKIEQHNSSSSSILLVKSASLAGRLSLVQILDQVITNSDIIEEEHTHTLVSYLLPQQCLIIGEVKWMLIGLVAPSMIWRIQSLLLALEARNKIFALMPPCETLASIQPFYTFKKLSNNNNNNNNNTDNNTNSNTDMDVANESLVESISTTSSSLTTTNTMAMLESSNDYHLPSPRLMLKALIEIRCDLDDILWLFRST